jgi:hypothetical protein
MNLLVKKFRSLAFILLGTLMIISCEDPGQIGLVVNANNGVITTHYQDIILPTSMVQFNPRKTSNGRVIQAGQYIHNEFGRVYSSSYVQLKIGITDSPQSDAQYSSFEMEASVLSLIGDEPNINELQRISIYQLADDIDSTINYTRVDQIPIQSSPLGVWEFAPKLNDTIQTDTSYVFALDNVVGRDLFDRLKAGSDIFESDAAFNAYFKGIAFVPDNNSNIFQINSDKIIFRIKYQEFNSEGTPIDREYEMTVGDRGFYSIDSDKSGTVISGISPDNSDYFPANDFRYLQYGTLMSIRADLTPFYTLTDTLENMIINKAVLSIGEVKQYGGRLEPPELLGIYFTDETNVWPVIDDIGRIDSSQVGVNFVMLQDEQSRIPIPPGGYFAPSGTPYVDNKYSVNIGAFLQNLYSGGFHSLSEPFLEEKAQIFIYGETNRLKPQTTITSFLTTPMAVHKDSIRLRIYYSVPVQSSNN